MCAAYVASSKYKCCKIEASGASHMLVLQSSIADFSVRKQLNFHSKYSSPFTFATCNMRWLPSDEIYRTELTYAPKVHANFCQNHQRHQQCQRTAPLNQQLAVNYNTPHFTRQGARDWWDQLFAWLSCSHRRWCIVLLLL